MELNGDRNGMAYPSGKIVNYNETEVQGNNIEKYNFGREIILQSDPDRLCILGQINGLPILLCSTSYSGGGLKRLD